MMNKQQASYWAMVILTATAVVAFVLAVTKLAPAAVGKKHDNSVGVVMQQSNPNTYIEGALTNVALVGSGVNIRVQPRAVYALYTDEILFCDYETVAEKFHGKSGVLVITYETVAHRTIEGVGCHDIRAVDEVKTNSEGGLQ